MESALAITHNKQELERLEGIIQKNIGAFYEVGRALMTIRNDELYLLKNGGAYQTFEAYCKGAWDFSRIRAYQLMEAVEVKDRLLTPVNIPVTEFQIRPLVKLEPDQQREAWQKAVETAPEGKVTAAHVSKVVKEMTGGPPKPYVLKKHKPIIKQELISEEFQVAYDEMVIALRNASETKWKETSYKGALELMKTLLTLTEQMGM